MWHKMHHSSELHLEQRPESDIDSIAHGYKDENKHAWEGRNTTVNCHEIHGGWIGNSSHRGNNTEEGEEREESEYDSENS